MDVTEKLNEVNRVIKEFSKSQPASGSAFMSLLNATNSDEGKIPKKYKELSLIAIAVTVKCEWCISYHVNNALKEGATRDEIIESVGLAVLMGGAPSLMYLNPVLDAIDKLSSSDQ